MAVLGALVVVALILSAAGTWWADDGDGGAPGGRDDDRVGPTAPDMEPATPEELRRAIDETSAFVAGERGLEFTEPVDVELADGEEFERRLLEDFDEDADELRETQVFLQAVGLVEPDVDVVETMRALLGAGVVGFYDAEEDELVVRGAALTPFVRTTLAHELTHALDDQHFDLHRPQYEEAADEVGFGFAAVAEGNARRVEAAYRDSLTDEERRAAAEEELSLGAGMQVGDVPRVLVDLIVAPYSLGEVLVETLASEGGREAVDAALEDPPRTSEQVMDPAAYRSGEERVDVPPPDVPGEVVEDGVAGQLLLLLVLAEHLGMADAQAAMDGWGGDWAVVWRDGDRSCVTLDLVGDTPDDTAAMEEAFRRWADAYGAAEVSAGTGDLVRIESCASA
ncbi:MAG TPA: hypothetical protein VFZ68_04135 [Acidimicrobiales bacterium]